MLPRKRAWEVHAVRRELRVVEAARIGVHYLDAQLRWGGDARWGWGWGSPQAWHAQHISLYTYCTPTVVRQAGMSTGGRACWKMGAARSL